MLINVWKCLIPLKRYAFAQCFYQEKDRNYIRPLVSQGGSQKSKVYLRRTVLN